MGKGVMKYCRIIGDIRNSFLFKCDKKATWADPCRPGKIFSLGLELWSTFYQIGAAFHGIEV